LLLNVCLNVWPPDVEFGQLLHRADSRMAVVKNVQNRCL
jgi:hypothetical protein